MSQQSRQAEYPDVRSTQMSREVQIHSDRGPRFELSVPKILAGALAAASAAVAASWLGVAGTVLGAVVASIVVSVTSAVYSHPLERSTQVIREALPLRPDGYRPSNASSATQTLLLEPMTDTRQSADPSEPGIASHLESGSTEPGEKQLSRPSPRRFSWATIVVSAVLTLVVGFGILTTFEAILGRSAASLTGNGDGGTTFSRIVGNGGSGSGSHNQQPTTPTQTDSPTDDAPTTSDPTQSPTTDDPTTTDPTAPEPTEPTPTSPTETQPPGSTTGEGADAGAAEGVVGGDAASSGDSGTL